jgi:hypothetical protein
VQEISEGIRWLYENQHAESHTLVCGMNEFSYLCATFLVQFGCSMAQETSM